MKHNLIIILFLLSAKIGNSQPIIKTDTLFLKQKIINYSIDATGNIFLSFEGGAITKYSATLDSLFSFSPTKLGNTTLLESGTGFVIFAFYNFFQEYLITNRFLTRPIRKKLSNSILNYVDLATQSLDNNIWLVENTNFKLIKYNTILERVELETSLNTIVRNSNNNFTFMKEYQNQVFLVDENSGIYRFDNLGNFLSFYSAKTNKCGFFKENLFFIENNKLTTIHIYSNKILKKSPLSKNIIGLIKHNNNSYFIRNKAIIRAY